MNLNFKGDVSNILFWNVNNRQRFKCFSDFELIRSNSIQKKLEIIFLISLKIYCNDDGFLWCPVLNDCAKDSFHSLLNFICEDLVHKFGTLPVNCL
jgi:hypothetical protein